MLTNPKSFSHIREHALGGAVHRDHHEERHEVDFDDPEFFSHLKPPRLGRARGGAVERDRRGHRIYSER